MRQLFNVRGGLDDLCGVVCGGPQHHVGADFLVTPGVADRGEPFGGVVLA